MGLPTFYEKKLVEARRDLMGKVTSRLKDMGLVPSSVGVTSSLNQDAPEVELPRLMMEQKLRKGGGASDPAGSPVAGSYGQMRYDFIKREEGVRKFAYDDKTGRPVGDGYTVQGNRTIGIGFNLERPDAKRVLQDVLDIDGKTFKDIYDGRKGLNDEQVRQLFDYTVQEAEQIINNKFGDLGLRDHQRLALVSLAFNNPSLIGPNLTRFVRERNWEMAAVEIRDRSNAGGVPGIASRRRREAKLFTGASLV